MGPALKLLPERLIGVNMKICGCQGTAGCSLCNPNLFQNRYEYYGVAVPIVTPKGWECPKCARVYAPTMMECWSCNVLVNNGIVVKEGSR